MLEPPPRPEPWPVSEPESGTAPDVAVCALCGDTRGMDRSKRLFDRDVCRRCLNAYVNRRQLAWILDAVLLRGLVVGLATLYVVNTGPFTEKEAQDFDSGLIWIFALLFLIKDGFAGYSPGKALLGLRVVGEHDGLPVGFGRSFTRNLPLLIPFLPLFVAFEMKRGPRTGDRWAGTRVVWRKYGRSAVFSRPEAVAEVFE